MKQIYVDCRCLYGTGNVLCFCDVLFSFLGEFNVAADRTDEKLSNLFTNIYEQNLLCLINFIYPVIIPLLAHVNITIDNILARRRTATDMDYTVQYSK